MGWQNSESRIQFNLYGDATPDSRGNLLHSDRHILWICLARRKHLKRALRNEAGIGCCDRHLDRKGTLCNLNATISGLFPYPDTQRR